MIVEAATATAALEGQAKSGDRGVVCPFDRGTLVALIDGLGHGELADDAARAAEDVLVATPAEPITELVQRCHERLRSTRGAVMSLASFDGAQATMTWLGVGNVEGFLVRADGVETIAMRGGTIGYMLPPLNPRTLSVQPGDTLVFASDGIRHGFRTEVTAARNPREIADEVLAHYRKSFDDACVVVARYLGGTLVS